MDFHILPAGKGAELADAAFLASVYQDEFFHRIKVNIFDLGEIKEKGCGMEKKIPQVLFLGAGEYHGSLGVYLAGSDHGSQGVKIRVDVSRNYLSVFFSFRGSHGCRLFSVFLAVKPYNLGTLNGFTVNKNSRA